MTKNVREWLTEHGVPQEALVEDDLPPMGSPAELRKAYIDSQAEMTRKLFEEITNPDGSMSMIAQLIVGSKEAMASLGRGVENSASKVLLQRLFDVFEVGEAIEAQVLLAAVFRFVIAFGAISHPPQQYAELVGALSLALADYGEGLLHERNR